MSNIGPEIVFCRHYIDAERCAECLRAERDQLRARLAELEVENAELRAIKVAVERTPKQWSTAQAPTMEAIANTARGLMAEAERDQLRAQVAAYRAEQGYDDDYDPRG